jgi:integrase/recombinase XerD
MMTERSGVRLRGPLAPYATGFAEELQSQGYTRLAAIQQVRLMAHVSRRLEDEGLDAVALTPARVLQFLEARRQEGCTSMLTPKAVAPLLEFLRAREVVPRPAPPPPTTAEEQLLARYHDYLVRERGLVEQGVRQWDKVAHLFVAEHTGRHGFDPQALTVADVNRLVVREFPRRGVSAAKNMAAALRSFLRFLYLEGHTERPLAQAVPAVASRKGASLPRAVRPAEVARLLWSCDRHSAIGRRDYAILMLLVRLGLRAGEVAGLELGDIDWRAGEIVVRGKGQNVERLPLPVDVGEAVADYLRCGRPRSESRIVFLRAIAPLVGLGPTAISWVVYSACDRAGLTHVSAHCLRHTAATEMLRAGASLPEVGQVLRHRRSDTTAIYAKVDHIALRPLALPWPGGIA